jgi:cardiolipin synthase
VEKVKGESRHEYGFFKYLYERGHFPAYDNASVKYFPLGEDKYKELVYQLERAEDFIFMEYFIVERGEMWNTILDILVRKVRQGVEVRFMYDGTCTLSLLPKNYPAYLNKLGINCKVFAPMKPLLSTHQNNRDHRKIAIIDGRVAFTGGVNLADEYINKKRRFGHWKDTAIMVGGEAVNSFTLMFLQMWNIDEHRPENYGRYLRTGSYTEPGMRVGGFVAPYGDCPYSKEEIGERVYLDVLNKAKDYVHIMTPYLILDEEFINTLIYTAQRGVDVKLILPHIPDKKYAYLLARTHYKELISEGVQIYEYVPGFVHAKVFVSDDERAVVGTINLDYRSLYLHFECAAYIWKNPAVFDVEDDFQSTLKKCMRIDMQNCEEYSLVGKIVGKALKLVAPLM